MAKNGFSDLKALEGGQVSLALATDPVSTIASWSPLVAAEPELSGSTPTVATRSFPPRTSWTSGSSARPPLTASPADWASTSVSPNGASRQDVLAWAPPAECVLGSCRWRNPLSRAERPKAGSAR
jgi:hypothetical protein